MCKNDNVRFYGGLRAGKRTRTNTNNNSHSAFCFGRNHWFTQLVHTSNESPLWFCCGMLTHSHLSLQHFSTISTIIKKRHKVTLSISASYLKSLVADFFAFLVPDNLGLWIPCGLAHKRGHSPLDACLVFWCSRKSWGCCMERYKS